MIELISNAVMANAVHTLEAVGYVTLAIAVFEHYTGVGPKMLPGKWSAVPALVLTIGLLAVFAMDQGLTPWWLVASVAIINGSLAGFGSNVAHIGAQAAGGGARRARAKEVVGELGAVQIGRDATDKDDVKSTTLHVTVPSKANYPTQVGSKIKLLACSMLVLLMAGCAQIKSASDYIQGVCEGTMSQTPEVQAEAQRKAVNPLVIAEAICLANDAGRAIWELFSVEAPDGRMTAAPEPQIERAKSRALEVARARGILP
jgi:hypothetical protein